MSSEPVSIVYQRMRYLFPKCTIEVKSGDRVFSVGQRVAVCSYNTVLGLIFARGRVATVAEVVRSTGGVVELKGEKRVILLKRKGIYAGYFDEIKSVNGEDAEDMVEKLRRKAQEFVFLINIPESDRLIYLMNFIHGLNDIIDFISHYFIVDERRKRKLYLESDPMKRSGNLYRYLDEIIAGLGKSTGRVV